MELGGNVGAVITEAEEERATAPVAPAAGAGDGAAVVATGAATTTTTTSTVALSGPPPPPPRRGQQQLPSAGLTSTKKRRQHQSSPSPLEVAKDVKACRLKDDVVIDAVQEGGGGSGDNDPVLESQQLLLQRVANLEEEIRRKDEQLAAKDEQLLHKDEQLAAKELQLVNSEIVWSVVMHHYDEQVSWIPGLRKQLASAEAERDELRRRPRREISARHRAIWEVMDRERAHAEDENGA